MISDAEQLFCPHGVPLADEEGDQLRCWRCEVYYFRHVTLPGWMPISVDEKASRRYRTIYLFWGRVAVMFWDDGAIHVETYRYRTGKRHYWRFREPA